SFVREQLWEAYRKTWSKAAQKVPPESAERAAIRQHRVLLMGGGSLIPTVRITLPFHPADNGHSKVRVQELETPADLFFQSDAQLSGRLSTALNKILRRGPASKSQPQIEDLPFLAVAYGLANIGISVPEITTPDEMPPM